MRALNLKHHRGRGGLRVLAVLVPLLFAARPVGNSRYALSGRPTPPPNAVDIWGEHSEGAGHDLASALAASRAQLARLGPAGEAAAFQVGGFSVIGNVAVLAGDDATVGRSGTGFGIDANNLAAVSTRFIQTFGDDYDQIAVFLGFVDRASPQSLAYQQPVKNDTKGLGLGLFDSTQRFGSSGRMQTVLNMKRINLYGRDAALDPDNGLYAVWAQEAGHRWLVYFRYRREGDAAASEALLGRQKAHWARNVQADGSIQDGFVWKDNGDGTFTPGERGVRYGTLDQYGMGLRAASEVPPFFLLENITDLQGQPVTTAFSRSGRYMARKVDLTVQDIIRAVGEREPATDVAAADLRMGVVLLTPPGIAPAAMIGEAFLIDNTRRLWTEFYNEAGGGRGKVCTELFRPCRGEAFEFVARLVEAATQKDRDGVLAPGETIRLEVDVTNVGDTAGRAKVYVGAGDALVLGQEFTETPVVAPGAKTTLSLPARITRNVVCGQPFDLGITASGSKGPSRVRIPMTVGLRPQQVESFDGATPPAGWRVNPDGTDTGAQGRWALGAPARTVAFEYTLQPGAAYSGAGAWATGLSAEQVDNVEGKTTLDSPPFPLNGMVDAQLSYQVYFVAADFEREVLVPAPSGALSVFASLDGQGWTQVDRVDGLGTGWQRRLVPLAQFPGLDIAGAKDVRLRFVVEESRTGAVPVVEAVIDDVGLFAPVAACAGTGPGVEPNPAPLAPMTGGDDSGGCSFGGSGRGEAAVPWLVLLGFAVLLVGRRRR